MKSMTLTAAAFAFGAAAALLAMPASANDATPSGAAAAAARPGWLPLARSAEAGCGVASWVNWPSLEKRLCGVAGIAERAARAVIAQDALPTASAGAQMQSGSQQARQL